MIKFNELTANMFQIICFPLSTNTYTSMIHITGVLLLGVSLHLKLAHLEN